jgi:hypothetical protein
VVQMNGLSYVRLAPHSRPWFTDLTVTTITIRPEVILPALQRLVQPKFPGVVFEIVNTVRWLVQRRVHLGTMAWNACFHICFACAESLPVVGEAAVVFKAVGSACALVESGWGCYDTFLSTAFVSIHRAVVDGPRAGSVGSSTGGARGLLWQPR